MAVAALDNNHMENDAQFADAIKQIDAVNSQDPRTELVDGQTEPRELLFSRRVYRWVEKLVDEPSEALLLAARAHTIRRWQIPRDRYPMNRVGYRNWRDALAQLHADEAESILIEVGYPDEILHDVRSFITKANWPKDTEACALEDADCLVFLECKLSDFVDRWEDSKMMRVLQRTYLKMTPKGRALALQLPLGDRESELVQRAVRTAQAEPKTSQ